MPSSTIFLSNDTGTPTQCSAWFFILKRYQAAVTSALGPDRETASKPLLYTGTHAHTAHEMQVLINEPD